MRKAIVCIIVIVLCVTNIGILAGCKTSTAKESTQFEANYDEVAWQNDVASQKNDNVNFATNGSSSYVIVYPDELEIPFVTNEDGTLSNAENLRLTLKNATNFLKQSLSKIVGCEFSTVSASNYSAGNAIELKIFEQDERLHNGGYALSIQNGKISISANGYQGLENGIYSFLEKYLGCMFVSADYDYLPILPTINFQKIDTFHNPDMVWRNVYGYELNNNATDSEGNIKWRNKLKLNGSGLSEWGAWVHTFFYYVPPEEYFESNPEYFAEYNGVRKYKNGPVEGQLCLTNENVYKIVTDKLFARMEAEPDKKYWDVSQMDSWINKGTGCTCKECKKLDDAEESPMGSLLTFINRIADECAEKFPNNYISTLAYNYSAKPPKTLKPRDNVIIKLCFMPGDVTSDLENPRSGDAKKSKELLKSWSAIAKNILIWDYNVNFHQYLMPYPIYSAMQSTNDFYLDNNVYGVFHQMDNDKGGDSSELSAYIFSQIMWDRTVKVEDVMNKYFSVYYGKAAKPMAEYYSALEKNAYNANRPLYIYSTVLDNTSDYLSSSNVDYYLSLFDKAEERAKNDSNLLNRIKKAKIGVLYVKAQEFSLNKSERLAALQEFKELCDLNGIDSIYEGNPKKDNEVETFYNSQLSVINAIPWIIAAIVVGSLGVATLSVFISYKVIKKKNKKAKVN